jgi:hypothetical protein
MPSQAMLDLMEELKKRQIVVGQGPPATLAEARASFTQRVTFIRPGSGRRASDAFPARRRLSVRVASQRR